MVTPPSRPPDDPPDRPRWIQAMPRHAPPASRAGGIRLGARGRGSGYACSLRGRGLGGDGEDVRTCEDRLAIGHTPVGVTTLAARLAGRGVE